MSSSGRRKRRADCKTKAPGRAPRAFFLWPAGGNPDLRTGDRWPGRSQKGRAMSKLRSPSKSPTDFRDRVLAATVSLSDLGGQGVLVPGGLILTAAHCIKWSGTGAMVLGDYFVERIKTRDGRSFRASVCAAEPVADIAAL